jgi:protein-S-isoprenylcysteine O-methyltransferase Ste14
MTQTQHTASDTTISPRFAKVALTAEKYLLPWVYGVLAYRRLVMLLADYQNYRIIKVLMASRSILPQVSQGAIYASTAKDLLLFLLMLFTGVTLLLSRAPISVPDKLKQIVVPLAMSYYFILYGIVDSLSAPLRESLIPISFQRQAALGGLVLSVIGYSIAIWALCHLGRSFAILASVRKVVSSGPYAYVRHPVYLGYAMDLCGLLLAYNSVAMLILGAGFVALLVCRARIEEEKLCEADEDYRKYVRSTGFLLPRFSTLLYRQRGLAT